MTQRHTACGGMPLRIPTRGYRRAVDSKILRKAKMKRRSLLHGGYLGKPV
jgi:hypothetical protein